MNPIQTNQHSHQISKAVTSAINKGDHVFEIFDISLDNPELPANNTLWDIYNGWERFLSRIYPHKQVREI